MTTDSLATRPFGRGGQRVTTVGFGAWAVGGGGATGLGAVRDDDSIAAIHGALEAGVNWIDTAPAYGFGHSEEIVGRALKDYGASDDVLVFTKCGVAIEQGFVLDSRPESLRRGCEASLRRLGVERLDGVQIHWPDSVTGTPLAESWTTLAELVDEGKVRWIGASNVDVSQLEVCETIRHVDLVEPPLSLLRRGARHDLVPWCERHGTAVFAYSPLGTGLLTGTYSHQRVASLPADDARARLWPDFAEPRLTAALELVERLRPVAARLDISLSTLAVAWVLSIPGVTGAVVGGRTRTQLSGWLPAANVRLDESALHAIDEALAATGAGDDLPPPTSF